VNSDEQIPSSSKLLASEMPDIFFLSNWVFWKKTGYACHNN